MNSFGRARLAIGNAVLLLGISCSPVWAAPPTEEGGDTGAEKNEASSSQTSLTQSLQGESGVSIQTMCTNCNSADLSLGGLGNAYIEMSCDGVPVPPGLAQIYLLSVMPPSVIDNVEVVKGAGSARLGGGAIGGVIDVQRRDPETGLDVNVAADTGSDGWRAGRADVSARYGWFAVNVAGSVAESDTIFADDDDVPDSPFFDRETIEGRLIFDLSDDHRIRAGASRYQEVQEEGRAAYRGVVDGRKEWFLENVDFGRTQYDVSYTGRFRGGSALDAGVMWSRRDSRIDEQLIEFQPRTFLPAYDIEDEIGAASFSYFQPIGLRSALRVGASVQERELVAGDSRAGISNLPPPPPGSVSSIVELYEYYLQFEAKEEIRDVGVWAEAEFPLGPRVDVVAGLRFVDYTYTDNVDEFWTREISREAWREVPLPEGSRLLPRIALSYKPTPEWSFRGSLGTGYRLPEPTFDEICCGRQFRGNRGVETERSVSLGFEATYQPTPDVKISASTFATDFDDHSVNLVTEAFLNRPIYQNVSVPEARIVNVGFEASARLTRWLSLKGSVSFIDAEQRSDGDIVPAILNRSNLPAPVSLILTEIPYVPERSAVAGVELRWPSIGLFVNVDSQYQGSMYVQDFSGLPPTDETVFDASLRETDSFWVTNVRATQPIYRGLELFVGVDNVTDYVQDDLRDPTTDYTWGPLRGRYVYAGLSYRLR